MSRRGAGEAYLCYSHIVSVLVYSVGVRQLGLDGGPLVGGVRRVSCQDALQGNTSEAGTGG